MSALVKWSTTAYSVLVWLYPPELRQRFGSEMTDTFSQQMGDAWEENGLTGFLEIWSLTLPELFRIALVQQAVRPVLALPFVSLLGTTATLLPLIWALEHPLALSAWYHEVLGGGCH